MQAQIFVDEKLVYDFILKLTPEKAREIGIKYRSTLKKLKDRVKEGEFKLNTKVMKKIIDYFNRCGN